MAVPLLPLLLLLLYLHARRSDVVASCGGCDDAAERKAPTPLLPLRANHASSARLPTIRSC